MDVYVNYLRRKVDDGYGKHLIHTIRGVGYELSARSQPIRRRRVARNHELVAHEKPGGRRPTIPAGWFPTSFTS